VILAHDTLGFQTFSLLSSTCRSLSDAPDGKLTGGNNEPRCSNIQCHSTYLMMLDVRFRRRKDKVWLLGGIACRPLHLPPARNNSLELAVDEEPHDQRCDVDQCGGD
jgi:hypothetical protein